MNDFFSITIIQPDLLWEDPVANRHMIELSLAQIQQKTALVLLPETFTTGFSMKPSLAEAMDGTTISWMKEMAIKHKIILAGSIIVKEKVEEEWECLNRFIWMLPNGVMGMYDKRHLFSYGNEGDGFKPGDKRFIASVNGWKFNVNICYDLRFPVWSRQQYPGEYDVLINVANWPAERSHIWQCLLQARAIENQCYVIGVNRVGKDGNGLEYMGNSIIIDPQGNIVFAAGNAPCIHTATISKAVLYETRQQFPFAQDADGFIIKTD